MSRMQVVFSAPLLNLALMVGHVYFGAGWVIGPDRLMSSGSFVVAREIAAQPTWGWLILAGAVLSFASPYLPTWASVLVRSVASAPLLAMAASISIADATGAGQGWGGPLLFLTPVLLHGALALTRIRHSQEAARG